MSSAASATADGAAPERQTSSMSNVSSSALAKGHKKTPGKRASFASQVVTGVAPAPGAVTGAAWPKGRSLPSPRAALQLPAAAYPAQVDGPRAKKCFMGVCRAALYAAMRHACPTPSLPHESANAGMYA